MSVKSRFLNYVTIDTQADESSTTCPSSAKQFNLARLLVDELQVMGLHDAHVDEFGYVYATLQANCDKKVPTVGFISHLDTAPDYSGANVKPQLIHYTGGDISLNEQTVLSPSEFPSLLAYIGQDIITTDGTSLLGADDKAGVAEIMSMVEYFTTHPEILHGPIKVGFTPDEEIGRGADRFDVEKFGADFAYTVDGGVLGELQYESFNAAGAKIEITGKSVHPGDAKHKMINAALIATEIASQFPLHETPQHTEHYEGFYHLTHLSGGCEHAELGYIIREFDKEKFVIRKQFVEDVIKTVSANYPEGTITLTMNDQYYNMGEMIEQHMHIIDIAKTAFARVSVEPLIVPVRGGTDGSRLSFMGLPTPNIFTGGHNFHGKFEYIPVTSMEKAVDCLIEIVNVTFDH